MMNKYWTIKFKTYEGSTKFASVVAMSVSDAIAWVEKKHGIDANQILYMNAEEVEIA